MLRSPHRDGAWFHPSQDRDAFLGTDTRGRDRSQGGAVQAVGFRPAMARSSTGKSVARAAATGGGTSYRGQMPVNWYAALVLIVLVGIASVAFARYNYSKTQSSIAPT